jgi:CubicO group peptidase (beta-lactamase class C family)/beta-glucosidase-like glycosyl hydrolase
VDTATGPVIMATAYRRPQVRDPRQGGGGSTSPICRPGGRGSRIPGPPQVRATASPLFPILLILLLGLSGCRRGDDLERRVDAALAALDSRGRVTQLIAVPIDLSAEGSAAVAAARHLGEERFGFLWVERGDPGEVARLAAAVRGAGAPRVLLGADLDGGVGGVVAGATAFPALHVLAARLDNHRLREVGSTVAREADRLGLDLGMIALPSRTSAAGAPKRAGDDAILDGFTSLARGLGSERLLVGARLFTATPGDTDRADLARLQTLELPLLERSRDAGFGALVADLVAMPAVTGDTLPFAISPVGAHGLLRRDLGWTGLLIADLRMSASIGADPAALAVAAIIAGNDVVIVDSDPTAVLAALLAAIEAGTLPSWRADAAARRVLRVKLGADPRTPTPPASPAGAGSGEAQALADQIAGELVARFSAAHLDPSSTVETVLVTPLGRGRAFLAELQRSLAVREVPINLSADPIAVDSMLRAQLAVGGAAVYLDFPGAAGDRLRRMVDAIPDTGATRARPIRVAFRDILDADLLTSPPDLLARGEGASSQRAAARLLVSPPPTAGGPAATPIAPIARPTDPALIGMDPAALQRVDRVVADAVGRGTFTAAALVIGRSGGVVRMQGFGTEPVSGRPVDPRSTIFDLASLTKVVGTTTAVGLLLDDGVIDLDAPVERYVTEFRGGDKARVTLRHLLAHNSGLPPGLALYGSASSREQALEQVIRQPLRRAPGERVEYSDLGMILLAEVLERASGTPIDHLLASRVFGPLGMGSTHFLPPLALQERTIPTATRSERPFPIRGVVHDGNAFRLGGITGHAGLFSTAEELAAFATMMLNRGRYGTERVLEEATVRALTTRQEGADTRALGWDTPADRSSAGVYFSSAAYGHTGYTGTSIWIDPRLDLYVILLTNRTFTEASTDAIYRVRAAVHDAAAQAVRDRPTPRRPGARP